METTLHRQLKHRYAPSAADTEVVMGDYRIDAVRGDELIEVQCASLGAINTKVADLLQTHQIRVVKPAVIRTRIVKLKTPKGKPVSRRLSPKRGTVLDIFEDLIYFTRVFPHPNLVLEVPLIHVNQYRVPSKKKRRRSWHKDYRVIDVDLEKVDGMMEFRKPSDLLAALPEPAVEHLFDQASFDTNQLAAAIDRPRWVAQKIAYVLKKIGSIEQVRRDRTGIHYQRKAA